MSQDAVDLPKLIIACPESDADQLYATRFFAPDAFLMVERAGRRTVLLSPLEVDRGRREAQVDEVLSTEPLRLRLLKESAEGKEPSGFQIITAFLQDRPEREYHVPTSFPLGLARRLEGAGFTLHPAGDLFYPERELKTEEELGHLREILALTERCMQHGIEILRESEPGAEDILYWRGEVLTSEILRAEIDILALRLGAAPENTIVAGGEQACDPHERGSGPLRAGELIILDFFPRSKATGFWGDLTRTVVKGRASAAQRRLWEVVLAGQGLALELLQPGADGDAVQKRIKDFFTEQGFPTEEKDGRWSGFFHGLGHGLGLELHEPPRISRTEITPGQVFTVEPGLYYSGTGGVRHEDVVVIREDGPELLTKLPKPLEL